MTCKWKRNVNQESVVAACMSDFRASFMYITLNIITVLISFFY